MITKTTHNIAIIAVITMLLAGCLLAGSNVPCQAISASGNITATCTTENITAGDEVRIEVSAAAMKISTFIASVEYDAEQLEYIGYEGPQGTADVYLAETADNQSHFDISIEHSETKPVIGMYAIGTTEKKYAAAEPLVTLVFKALTDGPVRYEVAESTSGEDGYTSESIADKSENTSQIDEASSEENTTNAEAADSAESSNEILVIAGIAAIVIIAIAAVVVARRRKDK